VLVVDRGTVARLRWAVPRKPFRATKEGPVIRSASILGCFLGLALAACSGDGGDDDETDDFDCSVSSRTGTYLMTFTEVSGTCGPFPSSVVRLDPNGELAAGCVLDAPTTISADECTVETSISCTDEFGTTVSGVASTKQANADGSLVTGIMTMQPKDADGPICASTYRLRYERQ
jgi:hypothetical protein